MVLLFKVVDLAKLLCSKLRIHIHTLRIRGGSNLEDGSKILLADSCKQDAKEEFEQIVKCHTQHRFIEPLKCKDLIQLTP